MAIIIKRQKEISSLALADYKKMTCADGTYMVVVKDHMTFSSS